MFSKTKKLIASLVLGLAICGQAGAAYIPTQQQITVGGEVFTDQTNLIRLYCMSYVNQYATCRKPGAASGYQVPVGKTFVIHALRVNSMGSTAVGLGMQLFQTDTDIGQNGSSNGTNAVPLGSNGSNTTTTGFMWYTPDASGKEYGGVGVSVAASKYITASWQSFATNNGAVVIFGYEQ